MMEYTASFTGHRPKKIGPQYIPGDAKSRKLTELLERTILLMCEQNRVSMFLCGMAYGFDLFAGQCVLRLRREKRIPEEVSLIAVQPYPGHLWSIPDGYWHNAYQEVLQGADDVCVVSGEFSEDVYARRNAFLVEHARYVIAYWNHNYRSGTGQTVRMAKKQDRVLINLYDL